MGTNIIPRFCVNTALIRGGQIIADAVVIGVTWKAIYHTHCEKSSTSFLARVMFRNGTQYFIILVTMNILHIIFTFLPTSFLHSSLLGASYVTKLSEPITTVLISRFMLDLHESNLEMARQGEMSGIQIMGSQLAGSPESYGRAAEGVEAEEWSVSSISGSDTE
ncbi:hypothetical protein LXA43DRAFT_93741 [Ganoderma leucocontextum]|nr:hypothetical protein LXA43DRAFT_93741 [Ganoderma leucocontextum]